MEDMRTIPIRRSINRPQMLLGGEAKLVKLSILLSMSIFISGMSLFSSISALLFWLASLFVLVRMGKEDKQMSKVYKRSQKYRPYYPAKSGLFVTEKHIYDWSDK